MYRDSKILMIKYANTCKISCNIITKKYLYVAHFYLDVLQHDTCICIYFLRDFLMSGPEKTFQKCLTIIEEYSGSVAYSI